MCHDDLEISILLSNGEARELRLSGMWKERFIQALEFILPCGGSYCLADLSQVTGSVCISDETIPQYTNWCFYWPGSVITSDYSNTSFLGGHDYDEDDD
ncbi:hypothetical protein GTP10_14575 [Lactiplantibacillus plantarum]|uniref:hypothetical protein n=1 Tax=Lactiplantibacillus plantarum TaxID=1590 RepID=UPI000350787B|nr:hypothetical protein [Lactiplantibacillus plantarum]AGO06755.1 hypothetical protein Lp16_0041 [Lactiplantibacillus plantarum 16]MBO2717272.1 hypothetical protein [Lactiplantibacillus plantarum]PKX53274.1 hypothetical protein BIS21_04825 [Lactiplantibacillus plantarum]